MLFAKLLLLKYLWALLSESELIICSGSVFTRECNFQFNWILYNLLSTFSLTLFPASFSEFKPSSYEKSKASQVRGYIKNRLICCNQIVWILKSQGFIALTFYLDEYLIFCKQFHSILDLFQYQYTHALILLLLVM